MMIVGKNRKIIAIYVTIRDKFPTTVVSRGVIVNNHFPNIDSILAMPALQPSESDESRVSTNLGGVSLWIENQRQKVESNNSFTFS